MILRTTDGGKTCTKNISVPGSYLFSVRFPSEKHGFVAGYDPATNSGVVLFTRDGGERWEKTTLAQTFGLYELEFPSPKGRCSAG